MKMMKFFHNFIFLFLLFLILKINIKINLFNFIFNYYSLDNFSYNLILLNLWILSFSIMADFKFLFNFNKYKFINLMILLNFFILMFFLSLNMFMFFIYFESSLIPIILLIMGWGYQIDRIQASMYMLFYTLFGSLPLLMFINFMYKYFYSCSMNFIYLIKILMKINFMIFLLMNMAFIIKMPMYLFHLWLPKAHVESPISGSMILAGIMLKLGSFGMLRFIYMMMNIYNKFNMLFLIMSIWGSIMCCFICMNINDLKIIIAYSSIVHMGSMLSNLLIMYKWSMISSLIMMIAHGLCSPLMFYISFIIYKRSNSRNLYFNKGIINIIPNLSMWWFLISICNMASPPSLNLMSEIMIFLTLNKFSMIFIYINMLLIFFSSLYNIFFYYSTQNKLWNLMNFNFNNLNFKEIFILKINWLILNLLFMNMYMYM